MKVIVRIIEHIFCFISKNKDIIAFVEKEYAQYIITEYSPEEDFCCIDIDKLVGENNGSYESIIKNVVINTIYEDGLYYLMHAGVVLVHSTAILICGKSMSGKSTACFLLHELLGIEYATDDVAFINKTSLKVNWISCPIKLRKTSVDRFGLKDNIALTENKNDGNTRYAFHVQSKRIVNAQAPIGMIVEIQYVDDNSMQSVCCLSGRKAFLALLKNSYSQNRLQDSYGTIVRLADGFVVKKVKYHDSKYLYNVIISTIGGEKIDEQY